MSNSIIASNRKAGASPVELEERQPGRLPYNSLFASMEVYHDRDSSRSASLNMAIDEALLETAMRPIIRFYRWDHDALSFGYFGKFSEIETSERDIVRRWTGGGIVYHDQDLTYSIIIPATDPAFAKSTTELYEDVHRAICLTLNKNGVRAVVAGVGDPATPVSLKKAAINERGYRCFATPVAADVMLDGRKIAGAAQRRTRRGLLQQGSIQEVQLDSDFCARFANRLSDQLESHTFDRAILERASQLADEKYASPGWLRRW